jgi:uncharacterized protein YcbX
VQVVGRVERLHRYPVKSLRGESPEEVEVDRRGVLADRRWALREPDGKLGSGKSTRRFRAMDGLGGLHARLVGGAPVVTVPDGRVLPPGAALDDALTGHVGRPVRLAEEEDVAHHDDSPVHLVTDASSRSVGADPACFRANLVVSALGAAGFVEDAWVGRDLAVGAVRLRVTGATERCVMVGAATLRTVSARNALRLGVYADVLETGVVRAGDDVVLG